LIDLISREMRVAMKLTGARSIADINRSSLADYLPRHSPLT
jgi:isopentenyl diphosphate isomerase/L-lactate dehydrogenase-like FMN-dependent dehydrogenase